MTPFPRAWPLPLLLFTLLVRLLLPGLTAAAADSLPSVNPQLGILIGQVTDAVDGHGVGGVRIEVRGQVTETDAAGNYRLTNIPLGGLSPTFDADVRQGPEPLAVQFHGATLPAGVSLSATAAGYAPYSSDRIVLIPSEVVLHHFSMTPLPAAGSLRLVLNWGAEPPDLDAHLGTPVVDGHAYEIYFPAASKGSLVSPPFAALDIDRTKGFGPETITINRFFEGTYRYFVYNYSGYVNSSTVPLSGSGATVKIYTENGEVQSISVPDFGTGLYWHVCDIDGTSRAIKVVNTLTDRPPYTVVPGALADAGDPPTRPRSLALASAPSTPTASYRWDFGDGTSSTEQNPAKTYLRPGLYTVALTVVAGGETNTTTKPNFITVLPVDAAPTLDPLPELALPQNAGPTAIPLTGIGPGENESEQQLTLSVEASDPSLFAALALDYAAPATNAVLTLQPARGRSGTNLVTVTLQDNGETQYGGTNILRRSFAVRVLPNRAPVFDFVPIQSVDELTPLTRQLTATDPEQPNSRLTFRLVNSPPGMELSSEGLLTWTPSEGQGPYDAYSVTAEVVDDGTPPQRATTRFFVGVREVNAPPHLGLTSDPVTDELAPFRFQLPVDDPDLPANQHVFRLLSGPPGLTVTAAGFVVWNPREENGPSTNRVVVEITDDGIPPLTTTNEFNVIVREVNAPPLVRLVSPISGSAYGIGKSIPLQAVASDPDPDGSIASVSFYSGVRRLGTVTTPPYTFLWTNPPTGPQTVTARATDNLGAVTASAPVTIAIEGDCTPRPDGLVMWLSGDSVADDKLGTNHAAWAANPAYATGVVGSAFDLRTTEAYLSVPDQPSLNSTNGFTIGLWLYREDVAGPVDVVAGKWGRGLDPDAGYSLEFAWWNTGLIRFLVQTANGQRSSGALAVPFRRWTYVAGVYEPANTNGRNVQVFVDGVSDSTLSPALGAFVPSPNPLQIGHDPTDPSRRFRGLVDEVIVAQRAFGADEIKSIVDARSSGLCAPIQPAANHPPTMAGIPDVDLLEDAPPYDLTITGISAGIGEDAQTITNLTAVSDNPLLIPDPLVAYEAPATRALLTLQPVPGRSGIVNITVVARDNGGTDRGGVDTLVRSFAVTVAEVNDAPRIVRPDDLIVNEDEAGDPFPLVAFDEETATEDLVFEFAASNSELLPASAFAVTRSGTNRLLQLRPATNQWGSSTIAVTVRDGAGATARAEFLFSAQPVNDPPTLDPIPDLELLEDTGALSLRLKGITAGPTNESGQALQLSATSDNPDLLPDPLVEYASPETEAFLTLAPVANRGGSARIRVTLHDDGGTEHGGRDTLVREFRVTVRGINDPPALTVPDSLTLDEDATGAVLAFEITDTETPGTNLTVKATATASNALGKDSLKLGGTDTHRTLEVTPLRDQSGTATITLEVRDPEGAAASAQVLLTVRPVNDPPTLDPIPDLNLGENASSTTLRLTGIAAGPTNEFTQALTVTAKSDQPDLVPAPAITYASPDTAGSLVIQPATGRSGTARITVTVTDNGGTARGGIDTFSRSFNVRVVSVNHPPRIAPVTDLALDEDSAGVDVPIEVSDTDTPLDRVTLAATTEDTSLFPAGSLTLDGTGARRTLHLVPAPNHSGNARIQLRATDPDGGEGELAFVVTVRPINDPPAFMTEAELVLLEDGPPGTNTLTQVLAGPTDEAIQTLSWTVQSDAPDLLRDPVLAYDTAQGRGTLVVQPQPNRSGTARLTVTLRDDGGTDRGGTNTAARVVLVRVLPVNDAPTLNSLPDLVVRQNTGPVLVGLSGIGSGASDEDQTLTVTASSDRPDLVPDPVVNYRSPDPTGQLTFQPVTGRSGTAKITLTVRDDGGTERGGGDTAQRQFEVLVRSNRPPVVALTQPVADAVLDAANPITLRAQASDPDGTVARVVFLANDSELGRSTGPVFTWSWTNAPTGTHRLTARATDNDGTTTESAPLTVTVRDTVGIDLTSPVSGADLCPAKPLIVSAALRGNAPAGARVTFLAGDAELATADAPPYSFVLRAGLASGAIDIRARLTDSRGAVLAESTRVRVTVREDCGDIAIVRNYDDPEVELLRSLLSGEDMGFTVDVFDQGAVTAEQLNGYQMVLWAGLARPGEGLEDADVQRFAAVHAAGHPLYLIGPRLASDVSRLGTTGRALWESLCGLRARAGGATTNRIGLVRGEPGDPLADGPRGLVADAFLSPAAVESTELAGTAHEIRALAGSQAALLIHPAACAPDSGQARIAVQEFAVGTGAAGTGDDAESRLQRERLFKNTVTWLVRGWYCENVALTLSPVRTPAAGRTGDELEYSYDIQHSGGCGAQGVTLSFELPAAWEVTDVATTSGTWSRTGSRVVVSLGCMDRGASQRVSLNVRAPAPGTFSVPAALRADALAFREDSHLVRTATVVEGPGLGPRLEIVRGGGGPQAPLVLRVHGTTGTRYRLQHSTNLRDWQDLRTLDGPEAETSVGEASAETFRYFRAVSP